MLGQKYGINVLFTLQFDIHAKNDSLKEQEAKIAQDTKPLVAEAPKVDEEEEDDSDLDIDNL